MRTSTCGLLVEAVRGAAYHAGRISALTGKEDEAMAAALDEIERSCALGMPPTEELKRLVGLLGAAAKAGLKVQE